jgi:vitamin-K-epoxide reductase (warfarin-sensitive)
VLSLWGIVKKGSTFDVPNSLIGSIFYFFAITPWNSNALVADLFMLGGLLSLAFSAYLAYILRFVLHEFCIICVSSYVINILLFIFSARERMRMIKEEDLSKKARKVK